MRGWGAGIVCCYSGETRLRKGPANSTDINVDAHREERAPHGLGV